MLSKSIKIVGLIFTSLVSLSACTDVAEYKTPELFFEYAERLPQRMNFRSSKEGYGYNSYYYDKDSSILKELKKITEYKSVDNIDDKSDIYFEYEYWQASNMGPNIERMTVFENGYLEIYHKKTIFKEQRFNYSIDPDLAASLNRYVENRIDYIKDAAKEAIQEAEEYISMENFINIAKTKSQVYSLCFEEMDSYDFYADVDVVNKIAEYEYTEVDKNDERYSLEHSSFNYNDSASYSSSFPWSFTLDKNKGLVSLSYYFNDKADNNHSVHRRYLMDLESAEELYNYALALAKKDKEEQAIS